MLLFLLVIMYSIVQYWDNGNPPSLIAQRMAGWQRLNPDWQYHAFSRDVAAAWIGEAFGEVIMDAFLDIRIPAMQADVFRVAYLLRQGGLWVDAATACLAPLQLWLDPTLPLLLLRRPQMQPPLVWNGFLYCNAPGHPLLQALWHEIAATIQQRLGTGFWKLVGPGLFRDVLARWPATEKLTILTTESLADQLTLGSSSEALPEEMHWSRRQRRESLYFSVD